MRALATEWAPHGITVNAVGPGYIHTELTDGLLSDPVQRDVLLGRIPMDRFGDPDDIAGPTVFLATNATAQVTGQLLMVDGRMDRGMSRARVGVVGAGIVGLAVARRIQQCTGAEVTVVEKERTVAAHQTGHNSNVVHSGVYYKPGSLKATLTRRGVGLLKSYCDERGLPYRELGKVIVAVDEKEIPRLHVLARRAEANDIPCTRLIGPAELRERQPHVRGLGALLIPSTAIVDYVRIAEELSADISRDGGTVLLAMKVVAIDEAPSTVRIATEGGELASDQVVGCAGLHSSVMARFAGRIATRRSCLPGRVLGAHPGPERTHQRSRVSGTRPAISLPRHSLHSGDRR